MRSEAQDERQGAALRKTHGASSDGWERDCSAEGVTIRVVAAPEIQHYLERELYGLVREDPRIFEFLQSGSLDGLWYWDLEQPEHEWMSRRFWETFGYEPSAKRHLAAEWQGMINEDDLKVAIDNFERHCADPRHPYDQIVRYEHANGSTVWVRCRGLAIRDDNGKPIRMLGAHTDVTALMEAEAALRRRQDELTRANEDLERFAYAASHDLKEPLRVVEAFTKLLREEFEKEHSDHDLIHQLLSYLEGGAVRLSEVVEGILEYSRVANGGSTSPVDTYELLEGIVADLDVLVRESRGEITWGEMPTIDFNPTQLRQVFQNLIQNALRYRRAEGVHVQVGAVRQAGAWVFSVTDDGIGIEPQHQERIFEIFKRLHNREEIPGTGLGLALCRRIIDRRGGHIWVESEAGAGATFSFSVPDVNAGAEL